MTMLEGTALVFLKLGAIAAVIAALIMALCRFLVARQRKRLAAGGNASGVDVKVEADIDGR